MEKVREHELYTGIVAGGNAEGFELYRIEDGSAGKKPFDIGGFTRHGRAITIEVKVVDSLPTVVMPVRQFASHQLTWLQNCAKYGGIAVAILATSKTVMRAYWLECETSLSLHPSLIRSQELILQRNGMYTGLSKLISPQM
jgi:hypothetical protein